MAWISLSSVSVANGDITVSVTGSVDLSGALSGWALIINNNYVEIKSGTSADSGGRSTLTLAGAWDGSTITNQPAKIMPTSAPQLEIAQLMTDTNEYAIDVHNTLTEIATEDKDVTISDNTGTEHTFASMPKNARLVQEMISEANSNLDSIFASIPQKDALEAASGGKNTILYDDQGNPNVMVWINKFNCEDIAAAILEKHGVDLNIGTGVHPAFIKDGGELRGFWYGKYQASSGINSGCSVIAGVQPYTGINYDQAKSKCTAKGDDWHLGTMHEWAAVSLLSAAYGAPVRGNTNYGRAHDATYETCRRSDNLAPGDSAGAGRSDCGTGPATWSHDGTMFGVFDMTGNAWEWQDLFKLTDGNIITTPDNNPNLAEESWTATTAFFDGDSGTPHLNDSVTAAGATGVTGAQNVIQDATYTKIELLRRMLVEVDADLLNGRFYINNDGERLPIRGGNWNGGSNAGLAALSLFNTRTNAVSGFGFRPAFFE